MIICEFGCGLRFHACKLSEHSEICKYQYMSCINKINGCPITLQGLKLASHLIVCPANVIHCTMEWNRWPLYSKDRQSRVPFIENKFQAVHEQLDVSLALRDQRMLNLSRKAPHSTKKNLRNSLTQSFPAMPYISNKDDIFYKDPSSQSSNSE